MRIYLDANYQESVTQDEEKIFTGYELVFTSAIFPTAELGFAMAVDQVDSTTYLVKFDWNSSGPTLWPMNSYRVDPSNSASASIHTDSLIYFANTASSPPDNFPVKGYIVGATKSIWAYNPCAASPASTYEQLFASPEN